MSPDTTSITWVAYIPLGHIMAFHQCTNCSCGDFHVKFNIAMIEQTGGKKTPQLPSNRLVMQLKGGKVSHPFVMTSGCIHGNVAL